MVLCAKIVETYMWIRTAALVTNFLSHLLQEWARSPICVSTCRFRSSLRINFLLHIWHVGIRFCKYGNIHDFISKMA